ncbi:CvpA family protein [Paenibacillus radicis (ex Xue et al. 2023)]|uniref:CvpA family protein n=1 Tax=Paenibacillus radicis (ex Xue et al. 2023) TaxID=2972489 RepID=A0ABT1YTL8_9BACL|nr:CvpA family protein [Paenibacillus radicis (ex Xue et al. 2023)]MCR8636535.1 CvpA family protein [Paenibacillus radicis (ex Xue et al. 2023)]
MNGLDWAAVVLTVAGTMLGYYRGLVSQLVSVAGLFIAYVVAFAFYRDAAPWIAEVLSLPSYETYKKYEFLVKGLNLDAYMYNAIAFALLLFGVKLALSIVGRVLNWIALTPGIKMFNKWSGGLLGFAEAVLLVIIAVQVMTVIPNDTAQRLLKGSTTAPYILNALPSVTDKLHELWNKKNV